MRVCSVCKVCVCASVYVTHCALVRMLRMYGCVRIDEGCACALRVRLGFVCCAPVFLRGVREVKDSDILDQKAFRRHTTMDTRRGRRILCGGKEGRREGGREGWGGREGRGGSGRECCMAMGFTDFPIKQPKPTPSPLILLLPPHHPSSSFIPPSPLCVHPPSPVTYNISSKACSSSVIRL